MIEGAQSLGDLSHLGYQRAKMLIQNRIEDPVLMAALIFNLDKSSGGWLCNLDAIDHNQANIYGFDQQGEYDGPTLIINGENSFLAEISRDPCFYRDNGLTSVTDSTIISVP